MSLRLRLMVAVLLTAVPLVIGMTWLVRDLEHRAVDASHTLHERALSGNDFRWAENCQALGSL